MPSSMVDTEAQLLIEYNNPTPSWIEQTRGGVRH